MADRFETRSDGLNTLLSGGFIKGGGTLVRYKTEGIADQVFLAVAIDVVDNMLSAVLIPRATLSKAEIQTYLENLDISLESLLDNDQLVVIDPHGGWDDYDHRNVCRARTLSEVQTATETALDQSRARGTVHMIDIGALVSAFGEAQARQLRNWYASDALRGNRDFLIEGAHVPPLTEALVEFYESMDDQVLRFYEEGDKLRVRIESGPTEMRGEVRTVESVQEPPFIRIK